MNKTIFNLDYKISVIIISFLGVLFAFLSNAFYVGGLFGFILYLFRFCLFISVFLLIHLIERNNNEFKNGSKRMLGYVAISSLLNTIFAVFTTTHLLKGVFLTLSGIVCFWLIFSFVIEILKLYFNNKIIDKIFSINEKIGLVLANPIVNVFGKITND